MATDGSRPASDPHPGDPAEHGSSGPRAGRAGALLGPVLFAVIAAVLIILAITVL
ncbi:MAG: hypothetical protein GX555_02075 [Actinomycetales bacterium]|nr:hypothetical protein [Actinomycetales bacterium]